MSLLRAFLIIYSAKCFLPLALCLLPTAMLAQGRVEKAVVIDNMLFYGRSTGEVAGTYLEACPVNHQGACFDTYIGAVFLSPSYDYPFVWDISDSLAYGVSCHHPRPESGSHWLFRKKLTREGERQRRAQDSLSSIRLAREYPDEAEQMRIINQGLAQESYFQNWRMIYPLTYLFKWLSGQHGHDFFKEIEVREVSFDMLAIDSASFVLFIRDNRQITVWDYAYPLPGADEGKGDWAEAVTYMIDTVGGYTPPQSSYWYTPKLAYHPSGKHHRYQSIPDFAFFQGHFKAICQGGETFIFNTTTGYLYHLGSEDIARVGQVNLQNYPRWLFGKPMFIEDRDAGELVFFAEVKPVYGARAFPKVALAKNRRALNERYPGLVGK